jgi:hypothetical protein
MWHSLYWEGHRVHLSCARNSWARLNARLYRTENARTRLDSVIDSCNVDDASNAVISLDNSISRARLAVWSSTRPNIHANVAGSFNDARKFGIDDTWSRKGLDAWSCSANINADDARSVNDTCFDRVNDDANSYSTIRDLRSIVDNVFARATESVDHPNVVYSRWPQRTITNNADNDRAAIIFDDIGSRGGFDAWSFIADVCANDAGSVNDAASVLVYDACPWRNFSIDYDCTATIL